MPRYALMFFAAAIAVLAACSRNPYKAANKTYRQRAKAFAKPLWQRPPAGSPDNGPYWAGTTNFDVRKPNFVIIHHTAQNSCGQTLQTFTTERSKVSAHYVICKDGTIHQMLNDYLRAWQAGVSRWGNATDINSLSVGIELDNNGVEPFDSLQIRSLLVLLDTLKTRYAIPTANFIGHADIAPGRKVDPNRHFPWQLLAANGFGYWYDTTGLRPPAGFDVMRALRIIGYNTKDSASAVYSFKLHFVQQDSSRAVTNEDRKILFDLERKYR